MIAKQHFIVLKRERCAFGRDIALRCPRPRNSGRNESPATHEFSQLVAPLNAARTAQRAVPTKQITP
jgi:hypothetical protein